MIIYYQMLSIESCLNTYFWFLVVRLSAILLRDATRDVSKSYELERNTRVPARGSHLKRVTAFNTAVRLCVIMHAGMSLNFLTNLITGTIILV